MPINQDLAAKGFRKLLILLGLAGFISHFMLIYAIQLSNLSFVTNFQYSQLIWSTIIKLSLILPSVILGCWRSTRAARRHISWQVALPS